MKMAVPILLFIFICFHSNPAFTQHPPEGFFLEAWQAKKINVPEKYVPQQAASAEADVFISIDANDTINLVNPLVFGNNANIYSTIMWNNATLVKDIRQMNPRVLRYPGGNLSNLFFWNRAPGDYPDDIPAGMEIWYGQNYQNWTMSVDNYYRFLDSVACTGVITLNYSYARYGTSEHPVERAAHMAAEWVRYDNGRTRFWEIGNENYGNWQAGYEIDTSLNKDGQPKFISGELYGRHCLVFIDSLRKAAAEVGNDIKIGIVLFEEETSWDPIQTDWNEGLLPIAGEAADYFIIHSYFTNYNENTPPGGILATYNKPAHFRQVLEKDAAEAGVSMKPIAMTEWNIFAVGSKQQVSHINGMHAVLTLTQFMSNHYGMVNRWNLANGYDNGNDHGTFSNDGDGGDVPRFYPRPVFYYITFFQKYFGDVLVRSSVSGSTAIKAAASRFSDGKMGVMLMNTGTASHTVNLDLHSNSDEICFYWYELVGGESEAGFSRQVVINGVESPYVAGGPAAYDTIPPFADTARGTVNIDIPAYGTIFMLIDSLQLSTALEPRGTGHLPTRLGLETFPNPFNASATIAFELSSTQKGELVIYDALGRKIKQLVNGTLGAGRHRIIWEGKDSYGYSVPSGIYLARLYCQQGMVTRKLVLLR